MFLQVQRSRNGHARIQTYVSPVIRIARVLLILAMSIGTPQLYVRGDAPAALQPGHCVDQQTDCANLRHSEARVAIVSVREATHVSPKLSKRTSLWQGGVLVGNSRTTTQDSIVISGGDPFTLAAAGLSSKPVRAPPASA